MQLHPATLSSLNPITQTRQHIKLQRKTFMKHRQHRVFNVFDISNWQPLWLNCTGVLQHDPFSPISTLARKWWTGKSNFQTSLERLSTIYHLMHSMTRLFYLNFAKNSDCEIAKRRKMLQHDASRVGIDSPCVNGLNVVTKNAKRNMRNIKCQRNENSAIFSTRTSAHSVGGFQDMNF